MHIDDRRLFPSYSVFVLQCNRPCCLKNTKFGQLILRKNIKIVATRCQFLRPKCTKVDFGWGSAPDPAGVAYSAPPDPLAVFKGPTSKGREGKGRGEKGGRKGEGGEGREEKGEGRERGGEGLQAPPMQNPGYATASSVAIIQYKNISFCVKLIPRYDTLMERSSIHYCSKR